MISQQLYVIHSVRLRLSTINDPPHNSDKCNQPSHSRNDSTILQDVGAKLERDGVLTGWQAQSTQSIIGRVYCSRLAIDGGLPTGIIVCR